MTSHTLVLLRHAKAETPGAGRSDAERPLAARGRVDAAAAGAWLAAHELVPDLVLCSPALRTRQTWAMAQEAMLRAVAPLALVPELYSAGVEAVFGLVAGVPDEIGTVLVVGHNPTVSVVSAVLDPGHGRGDGLRTAGIAVHTLDVGWSGCTRGAAPLITTHTARGSWRS